MTIEDRLREAIHKRTRSVEPSPDALERITRRLDKEPHMNLPTPTTRWLLPAAAILLVVVTIAGGIAFGDDVLDSDRVDVVETPSATDPRPPATPTTTPPSPTTTSTGAATGQTTAPTALPDPGADLDPDRAKAIWPRPSSTVTFDTPEAAARSFALYYAFFADPVVGTFRAAGNDAGEVPVRAAAETPETRVLVRRFGDGNWYVTGSRTTDVTVTDPAADAPNGLVCPRQAVSGLALAYEGHVNVRIDAYEPDGDRVQLGQGFVTGSGSPPAGPFSGSIDCSYPSADVEDYVVLTLWTESQASPPELTGTLEIVTIPLALPG